MPQSHTAPLRDPKNHANINWDPCWDDPAVESQAVLLDPRPQLSPNDCLATMVLWNSRTIHCSGNHLPRKRAATQSAFLSRPPCQNGHFDVNEHQAWTKYLEAHGYVVLELKMTREEHAAHVFRFRQAVQLVNRHTIDEENQEAPRLAKIQAGNLPPYKTKGLQQFYGFCHTPFADAMRTIPEVRRVFERIYGTTDLYASIDAGAIAMAAGKNEKNWLHRDQTKNPLFSEKEALLSVQGCVYLRPPLKKYMRLAQMVAWHPLDRLTEEEQGQMVDFMHMARRKGACLTHNNHKINKEADKLVGNLAFFKQRLQETFRVFASSTACTALTNGKKAKDVVEWRTHCFV